MEAKTRIDELRELWQHEMACVGRAYRERTGLSDLVSHVEAYARYRAELDGWEAKLEGKGR